MTEKLVMPEALDSRLFHSKQKVDAYNQQVADYMAQQDAIEYSNKKNSKRCKHPSRRQQYEQN